MVARLQPNYYHSILHVVRKYCMIVNISIMKCTEMKVNRLFGPVFCGFLLVSGALTGVQGRQVLHGHVPAVVARLQPIDRLEASSRLNLAIGLPLRNPQVLNELLRQIYDPTSPGYRRYLTPEQFTEQFGPTAEHYEAVIAYAKAHGLTVTGLHSNRLLLNVSGTVADIERAFQTTLRVYAHPAEARTFYAPDLEPVIDLDSPVLDLAGLNNFILPQPKNIRPIPADTTGSAAPKGGSASGGAYLGYDFRAAYLPGVTLTGTGQVVGLLEFDGYYANDITAYQSKAGLPKVPLQNVLVGGFNGIPTTGPNSGNNEVALDIQMTISMAPGLSKVIVYEAGPYGNGNDILNRMATDNLAKQISCSWSFPTTISTDQIFKQFAAQGQTFFNASGDTGAFTGTIPTPDDDLYITLVGGTTLTTTGPKGNWVAETTWNSYSVGLGTGASSGGISTINAIPSWQKGIDMTANRGSTTKRNVPDVAMVADNIWLIYSNGKSGAFGGTSCAAPLWAAFTALVNEQASRAGAPPVGFLNPALYNIGKGSNYKKAFHDITTGNNRTSGSAGFPAVAGYDLCTGWGTPTGQNLIDALAGMPADPLSIAPGNGFTANGPVGGPFNLAAQNFALTNSGAADVQWQLLNPSLWFDVRPDSGILSTNNPTTTVTVSLNTAAGNLAPGVYTNSIWITNLTTGAVQSRQFTLRVGQNLVQNGGFESGDLSNWILTGNATVNYVVSRIGQRARPQFVHSGTNGVLLAQVGSLGYLTQTVPTVAGQAYLLSFWMVNPYSGDTPNEFEVQWNVNALSPNILFDQVNMDQASWTNIQFIVFADGETTELSIGARNDPNAFGLDDVSVLTIPTPKLQSVSLTNGMATFAWNALTGLVYQVQYKTDLNLDTWSNLGDPVTAADTVATASDVLGTDAQRFYRVILLP